MVLWMLHIFAIAMMTLLEYKDLCIGHGLCDPYRYEWDRCSSDAGLLDVMSTMDAMEWMCESVRDGWGMDKGYIVRRFGSLVNGSTFFSKDGEDYCASFAVGITEGVVKAEKCDLLYMQDCKCTVVVSPHRKIIAYVCGDSEISFVEREGACVYAHIFGANAVIHGASRTKVNK